MTIDYGKLNDRVVKQAYDATSAFLTEAQRQKLFQNKIDRAAAMIRAQEQFRRLEREDNWPTDKSGCRQRGPVLHYNQHKRAACRMNSLLWDEKLQR